MRSKKNKKLINLLVFLVVVVSFLAIALWYKTKFKKEDVPTEKAPLVNEIKKDTTRYSSLDKVENQIKGSVAENRKDFMVIEEIFPTQRMIKLGAEEIKGIKLKKISPKNTSSLTKMDSIQEKIKSIREKKSEELQKDSPDNDKIVSYNKDILNLLNSDVPAMIKEEDAKIEDFVTGSKITFSRLNKTDFELAVYSPEMKIYFPD